jgi:cysteine desulfurase
MGFRIYLDYAASTPVDPRVKAAMEPYFSEKFGNAASVHYFGQGASAAIFKARQTIAGVIGAKYDQIIFTGSATEANNLAIRGVIKAPLNANRYTPYPRIIVSAFEHPSILETCRDLKKEVAEVVYLPISRAGFVDLKKLKSALNERTILVSVMYVNNEVGTIQPISEIAKIVRDARNVRVGRIGIAPNERSDRSSISQRNYPLFHTDAVQAFQYLDCNVDKLGVDLMTLSAHKIYGPKGVGALYIRNQESGIGNQESGSRNRESGSTRQIKNLKFKTVSDLRLVSPIVTGGGQEPRGLHSGTQNTPAIVGFGKAAEIGETLKAAEFKRITALRGYFWRKLKKARPAVQLNGSLQQRIPNNLNIYFPGQSAMELMIKLDLEGAAVSAGSACSVGAAEPSAVLLAMGFSKKRALESLRITLGRPVIKNDIDRFVKILLKFIS